MPDSSSSLRSSKQQFLILCLSVMCQMLAAQDPLPAIQFGVPYRCANGTVYVFDRCEQRGRAEVCFYHLDQNGQNVKDIVNVRSQLTGIINTCPAPAPKASQTSQPAQRPAAQAPPLPQGIPNRPTDPPYLREMPPPERVLREIQGANPTDTIARQIAVFGLLERSVERIMDPKRYRKTPDEDQVRYTYSYAAWKLGQDFAKSHTPEEAAAMTTLQGRYDMDGALFQETLAKFYTPNIRAQHAKVDAAFEAKYKARVEESKREQAAMQQPQAAPSPFVRNDPGTLAARRCIELGGSELGCVGKGLMTGFFGEELSNVIAGKDTSHAGLTMTGRYGAPGNVGVWFGDESMGLGDCGKLIVASHAYSVAKNGNRFAISVQAEPKPFVMNLAADGSLTGPGPIDIKGQIITGYRKVWMQAYANGQPVVGANCGGACGYYADEPIYATKTERCTAGALRPQGPTGTFGSGLNMIVDFASGEPAEQAARDAQKDLPAPGVRMIGTYGTPGGIALEFRDDAVVLDCADAHVARPYAVENTPNQVVIHVKNANSPFTLALQPNGALAGSGMVDVVGRVVTGSTPGGIAYGQRNGRCALGTLPPKGASPGAPGMISGVLPSSQPSSPAPGGGAAILSVSSGLPSKPGYPNPLASISMYLLKESFASVAAKNGVQPAAGQNAIQAWGAACEHQAPECRQAMTAAKTLIASRLKFDLDGHASFSGVPAGKYHLFGFVLYEGHHLVWDLPLEVKNGPNAAVLDQRNAYSMK